MPGLTSDTVLALQPGREARKVAEEGCCASGRRQALSRGSDAQSFLLASFLPAVARQARMVLLIK